MKKLLGAFAGLVLALLPLTRAHAVDGTLNTLVLTPGSAPVSPVNGQMWMTSAGLYARINGVTAGPYGPGTVTSTGLTLSLYSVANSPVTSSGTLTATLATQAANLVLAGPTSGSAAAPAFRALVAADLPVTAVTPAAYTCANITVDPAGRLTAAASGSCSGGGGLTNGSTSISGGAASKVLIDTGGTLGELAYGLTGNSTLVETTSGGLLTPSVLPLATSSTVGAFQPDNKTLAVVAGVGSVTLTDTVHTTSVTTANIGGQDDYNQSGLTATLAVLAAGQTLSVTDQNSAALTIALGGQTVVGLPLATTLHTGGFYNFAFNSLGTISGYGFPGFGTITPGSLMKFVDGSGAAGAASASDLPNTTDPVCATWDSTTSVTAQTIDFPVAWNSYTLAGAKAKVAGGGSFTYTAKIGGTNVTGLTAVTVNSSSNVNTSASASNTGTVNDIISIVIASPSGTVNTAYVCLVFSHSGN